MPLVKQHPRIYAKQSKELLDRVQKQSGFKYELGKLGRNPYKQIYGRLHASYFMLYKYLDELAKH